MKPLIYITILMALMSCKNDIDNKSEKSKPMSFPPYYKLYGKDTLIRKDIYILTNN